jgi:hypothetical protein
MITVHAALKCEHASPSASGGSNSVSWTRFDLKGKLPCRQLGPYRTRAASRRTSIAGLSSRSPT